MLLVVENVRRKQLDWIDAIMRHKRVKPSRMAKEAGVNHATILKFISDPLDIQLLNTRTVQKLENYSGIPPYELGPLEIPRGFSENESEPYHPAKDASLNAAVQAIKQGRNGVDAWVLNSRALEGAGYMPGDVLVIDLNAKAADGDVVCAQIYDRNGRAETVMRIYEDPFLVSLTSDRALLKPALVDNDRVMIRGVVIASLRGSKAA